MPGFVRAYSALGLLVTAAKLPGPSAVIPLPSQTRKGTENGTAYHPHCQTRVQIFEEHRQIYTWESTWSPDAYGAERHSSKQFREDLARQREWRAELDRMKVGNSIGVLHIDSKSLRNSLLPVTARTLDAVKVVLLAAAREETVTVLMSFQQRIRALQDRPDQLDNFVDFMKLLEEMGEARKAAMAEVSGSNLSVGSYFHRISCVPLFLLFPPVHHLE